MKVTMKLWEVRESKNINMRELSMLSKVAYSHIWKIENENRIPTLTILCKLAIALDVDPQELYSYKKIN